MAANNSTVLNQDINKKEYSGFANDFSYKIFQVKAMIAGARAMVYGAEEVFIKNPDLLDVAYLLDDVEKKMTELAGEISNTEFDYQLKLHAEANV